MANPWDNDPIIQPAAPRAGPPPFIAGTPDPYKANADARAAEASARDNEKLNIERERLDLARQDAARHNQEAADKRAKLTRTQTETVTTFRRVLGQADQVARMVHGRDTGAGRGDREGAWMLGGSGAISRASGKDSWLYAGTDAANFDSALNPIIANVAFDKLQEMRQNSPTGGAVGNVSDADMALLKSTIADLGPAQDYNSFMKNLAEFKDAYLRVLGKLDPKAAHEVLSGEGVWKVPGGKWYYGKLPADMIGTRGAPGNRAGAMRRQQPSGDIDAILRRHKVIP